MKHWFITGISRGLGLALTKAVLAQGDRVVGTVRNEAPLNHQNLQVLRVDMADEHRITVAVDEAFRALGRIDVIVNNAGYGLLGAIETTSNDDMQTLFQINVFAPVQVIRSSLPYLREQGSGHIVNLTSIAGRAPGVGAALYAASKYALEGFSAALTQEVASQGIHVTAVAPGQFRTDFLSNATVRKRDDECTNGCANDTVADVFARLDQHQPGDPERAAQAIIEVVNAPQPPLHLLLGPDALERACRKMKAVAQEMEVWESLTRGTDFERSQG